MMFSDEEIKEIREGSIMRPGDEIISIHEVCLSDRSFDKKDLGYKNESLLHCDKNDLEPPRSLFRDVFPEGVDHQQARFAWTEEDGNIASLVSEPGFGTTGRTTFGKELDSAFSSQMKEADTSSAASLPTATGRNGLTFAWKMNESQLVSSTSSNGSASGLPLDRNKSSQGACKVDKTDPRSRFHFVKYVKRQGKTVKLWECGICGREFQHQYTLMRHLPTHTDERNFHCSMCGKSFRQLSTLSQHRAIHSAERPYACEMCNKTFNRVSTLISHRKTHSDEKPYKCHMCPKGFHQKGNLRNHLFTHTNERPYRCNICMKGFNQQSNLVCHKNKAHSEDGCSNSSRSRSTLHTSLSPPEPQPDSTKPPVEHCEVSSSSIGYHLPSEESSSTSWQPPSAPPSYPEPEDLTTTDHLRHSGVVVDPIKTYHMGVALATKQTPFALLKPDNNSPVLVKVVDTNLPGGKQMLVPATAEDLRVGGKIVVKNDDGPSTSRDSEAGGEALQIRVPVVAIVVPSIKPGGRLQLVVEEPHHIYHTALSTDLVNLEPCTKCEDKLEPTIASHDPLRTDEPPEDTDPIKLIIPDNTYSSHSDGLSSSFALPPPAPSPPLGLISMDLFEPIECMPMGPQITPVDNIDQSPPSDDSDIFIAKFEESIPLSDSD